MTTQHSIQIQSGAVNEDISKPMFSPTLGTVESPYGNHPKYTWFSLTLGTAELPDGSPKVSTPPKSSQLCIHCTNQSKYEYLGMKLCYPHYLAEERVND